jgi:hypothetical protein
MPATTRGVYKAYRISVTALNQAGGLRARNRGYGRLVALHVTRKAI